MARILSFLPPVIAALLLAGTLQSARADQDLTFGTYSSDKPSSMVRQLGPIIKWVAARTGKILREKIDISIRVVRGYNSGVALITESKVDFARLGAASYVGAKKTNPLISIIAMEKKNGRKTYNGIIAVHKNSPYKFIKDLRGVVFGFGNEQSTLGRYFAQLYLTQAGIRASDLKSYKYLGRHDAVGRAVGSKLIDAGALEETTFEKLVGSGVPIRAIAMMRNATRPWVARANLDKRIFAALRQAMLDLDDQKIAYKFRFQGFLLGRDADFDATRRAIRDNYRFFAAKG